MELTNQQGAIFDLDGTLIDSLWIWEKADGEVLKKHGFWPDEAYFEAVRHRNYGQCLDYILERYQLPLSREALSEEIYELAFQEYDAIDHLKPGAKEYLHQLKEAGVHLAMATACLRPICERVLQNLEVFSLFETILYSDEFGKNKTEPDIYLAAAQKLGLPPEQMVVFEDVDQAVRSAKRAGMITVGVGDPFWEKYDDALRVQADYYITDFWPQSTGGLPLGKPVAEKEV